MDTFKKLKAAREHLVLLPGLRTYKDFDIAIEIGYHEKIGKPLSLKELLLLETGSPATVRRHLNKLVKDGMVIKSAAQNDQRVVQFSLSPKGHESFKTCYLQLQRVLSDLQND